MEMAGNEEEDLEPSLLPTMNFAIAGSRGLLVAPLGGFFRPDTYAVGRV